MADVDVLKGIGAELSVDADMIGFKRLFADLGKTGIQTVDADSVHITLVDPWETRIPILSVRDQAAIDSARSEAGKYLSAHIKAGLTFTPASKKLMPYGYHSRKVGILVEEVDHLRDLREGISAIFFEEAKIILTGRKFEPHVTLGAKVDGFKKMHEDGAPFRHNKHSIPSILRINGFTITERIEEAKLAKEGSAKYSESRYRNKPRSVRRA